MTAWNPSLYLKFEQERTQPAIDLAARIDHKSISSIIDMGCGPGNSTKVLCEKWPKAEVTGLDNSEEMIKKAREFYPEQLWILGDAGTWMPATKFDLVFSNAALQWLPDHNSVLRHLISWLSPGGVLAAQIPSNQQSPMFKAIINAANEGTWADELADIPQTINYQSADYYYDMLSTIGSNFSVWETTYYHALENHYALMEWYKSTGMRPYLERLQDATRKHSFEDAVLQQIKRDYLIQKDGKVIFPFNRLFFIVYPHLN